MPVLIKCIGTLLPNKPPQGGSKADEVGKYEVSLYDIAHTYTRPDGQSVRCLKPKIDHLSVVLPISNQKIQKGIMSVLVGMKKDVELHEVTEPKSPPKVPSYKVAAEIIHPPTGSPILLQAGPNSKKAKHFLRLQMNPSALGMKGVKFLRDILTDLMNDDDAYLAWLNHGRVTRVDVACDFINAQIGDLLFHSVKGGKTHGYYSDVGDLQTVYLGLQSSDKNSKFYVYDKATEQRDKDQPYSYGGVRHTRIEFRIASQKAFKDIKSLSSPFEQLEVYDCFAVAPPEGKHHWLHFMDSCRHRGIENALEMIPEPTRTDYRAALNQALHDAWPAEKLWSWWEQVVEKTGILEPD